MPKFTKKEIENNESQTETVNESQTETVNEEQTIEATDLQDSVLKNHIILKQYSADNIPDETQLNKSRLADLEKKLQVTEPEQDLLTEEIKRKADKIIAEEVERRLEEEVNRRLEERQSELLPDVPDDLIPETVLSTMDKARLNSLQIKMMKLALAGQKNESNPISFSSHASFGADKREYVSCNPFSGRNGEFAFNDKDNAQNISRFFDTD